MVIVTLDNGGERLITLADHVGYKASNGRFRVIFKDGLSGEVTHNPAPSGWTADKPTPNPNR